MIDFNEMADAYQQQEQERRRLFFLYCFDDDTVYESRFYIGE